MTTTRAGESRPGLAKGEAQRRADQIAAFRRELSELERVDVLALGYEERNRVQRYHAELLGRLAEQFDVDGTEGQRQLSLGMRIASLVGAVTLSAGVVLLFYRIWGLLGTPAQVGVLAVMPLLALGALELAARREKTLYVASLFALLATAAFILDVSVVGVVFNMRPSPWALGLWAVFALAVAYAYRLRLMLAIGLGIGLAFLSALVGVATGLELTASLARPEPIVFFSAVVLGCSVVPAVGRGESFPAVWRLVGTAGVLLPILFLATWPEVFSYRFLPLAALHALYDVSGLVLPAGGIWFGIRRRWPEVVNPSSAFLVAFVYAKCFDWWWTVMPRYLFFLLLGALAIGALVLLGRLRARQRQVQP